MSKVTAYLSFPDIIKYDEEDEELESCFVGTFEKCKEHIKKETMKYLDRLEKLHYKDWKKDHTI